MMRIDSGSADYRPRAASQARLGPSMTVFGRVVYYLKNESNGAFFRLGAQEAFLFSLMDGSRTLEQICDAYQAAQGVPLPSAKLAHFLDNLARRELLVLPGLAGHKLPVAPRRLSVKNLNDISLRLINPTLFLERIEKPLRRLSDRTIGYCVAAIVLLGEVYAILNLPSIAADIRSLLISRDPAVLLPFVLIVFFSAFLHELAHGVMCQRHGGTVSDMGIMFKYLMLFPYCRLDDLVILPERKGRIASILAGVSVNLIVMAPFALVHYFTDASATAHKISSLMLSVYNVLILLNLLPFLQLDGYILVSTGRGRPELREESLSAVRRLLFAARDDVGPLAHPSLIAYGFAWIAVTFAVAASAVYFWAQLLSSFDVLTAVLAISLTVAVLAARSHSRS